ncbi:MAG: PAS domain-containing protein [Actinomycetota bacterium]|nr:PAS domain-containing protein [Actinomycetota bacterium]
MSGPDDPQLVDDARLALLVHGLSDAVIVADAEGTIALWNASAERVFGWPRIEALGQSLDLIIPERHRAAHGAGFAEVMRTGVTKYATDLLEVPALHADGERRRIAFTVTLLTDEDGNVEGIAAVVRDDTERSSEVRELRARLAERDVTSA